MLWKKYYLPVLTGMLLMATTWVYAVDKVDINTADAATLDRIMDGIGAKKAEAIVKYRQENGYFKSIQDLEKVSGIGAKTIEKNRDRIVVSVDINQADAETLVKMLDGISTEFALSLVEYRNKRGAFKSVDEVAQVPGLTKETFDRNKERLSIVLPKNPPVAPVVSPEKTGDSKTQPAAPTISMEKPGEVKKP